MCFFLSFGTAVKRSHEHLTGREAGHWLQLEIRLTEEQRRVGESDCGLNGAFFCAPPGLFES